jgi:hypothetical protein
MKCATHLGEILEPTYWGQRPLLPRLVILLSAQHFHYAMLPFIVTSVAAQVSTLLIVLTATGARDGNASQVSGPAAGPTAGRKKGRLSFQEGLHVSHDLVFGVPVPDLSYDVAQGERKH